MHAVSGMFISVQIFRDKETSIATPLWHTLVTTARVLVGSFRDVVTLAL